MVKKIGKNIRAFREFKNLSLSELSHLITREFARFNRLRCNHKLIARWELGKAVPSQEIIIALSDIMDVSTDELLYNDIVFTNVNNFIN